ncbi:DUF3099 domain-containing protein [Brevibacterium sp. JSBI002]|uniref:DUF3099 domain-containing protein n=1 Tax=Brevibacterium sp. JSBI002 TaxID=2886045 RepID=UPI00222E40E8|nr:DUF3099 domain-containing protein [Brevibacterium sp. JSBI002]UZD63912.1 DUF3099 domain-containing protein [Brevibacterium sp. JSBI002]
MRSRIIKYSITMGIRTVCFVAAYFAFVADMHILMWICVAGAVVLPYPAVIFANAGRERTRDDRSALLEQAPLAELPPARGETISGDTLGGETVDDAHPRGGASDATDPGADHRHETIRGETTIPGETVQGETSTTMTRTGGTRFERAAAVFREGMPGVRDPRPAVEQSPRPHSRTEEDMVGL